MNNKINIAYTINHEYLEYLYISLLSLLRSNAQNDIVIHILSSDLSEKDQLLLSDLAKKYGKECFFYSINDLKKYDGYVSSGYSVEVYLRLFLPWTLKSVKKVLYLDADTYIQGDISVFYNIDLPEDKALAGCMDSYRSMKSVEERNDIFNRDGDYSYYNAGVMLWNLDYFRREIEMSDFGDVITHFGNRLLFNDQDILNYLCYQKITEIDTIYNYMPELFAYDYIFDEMVSNAVIIHYAGCSPWRVGFQSRCDLQLWWKLAQTTPVYTRILEKTLGYISIDDIKQKSIERISKAYSEYKLKEYNLMKNPIINKCSSIAIYGLGSWGKLLLSELNAPGLVKYIFDRNDKLVMDGVEIKPVSDISYANETELLIITPVLYYKQIYDEIVDKIDVKIINLIELFESCF